MALVELLICAVTKQYCKLFQNATSKSEGSEHSLTKRGKIIDAGRKTSYVLNSWDTNLNLTKFTNIVQK